MRKFPHRRHTLGRRGLEQVTIRRACPDDARRLAHLAALDSQRPPAGDLLVAEVDGALWAAVTLDGTVAIADPFRVTADLMRLLRVRSAQLQATAASGRRPLGRLPRHLATRRQPAA